MRSRIPEKVFSWNPGGVANRSSLLGGLRTDVAGDDAASIAAQRRLKVTQKGAFRKCVSP